MDDAAPRKAEHLAYSPVPRSPRKEERKSPLAALAGAVLAATAAVYLLSPAPAPLTADVPPPPVSEPLPAPALAPAREAPSASPAPLPPTAPPARTVPEAVFTHYTTEPGAVSRAVVRLDGKVVLSRSLFRGKKTEGGADIRALPPSNCASTFLARAGAKTIYKDSVTAALPVVSQYSMEVRWYDADGDELSRDAYDVDGKKAVLRHTSFRQTSAPMLTQNSLGGVAIETGGITMANANSMGGAWAVPKRPSWQPELPRQDSFFGP